MLMGVGVGGLWGHMGDRWRVGWKAGFGVSLVIDVQKEEEEKKLDLLSFNMIPHQAFPLVFFSLYLSVTLAMTIRIPKSEQDADQLFPGVQPHIAQILYRRRDGYTACYLYRRVW